MKPAAVPAVLALIKNGVNMKPNISCNKQIGHQTIIAYSTNVKTAGFFQFRETWSIIPGVEYGRALCATECCIMKSIGLQGA